jgi:hypothetical protein
VLKGQREARREKRDGPGAPVVVPHESPPIVAEL